jgi:hypothetical protein
MISYATLFLRIGRLAKLSNDYLTLQGTTLLGSNNGADDILDEYAANRELVPTSSAITPSRRPSRGGSGG